MAVIVRDPNQDLAMDLDVKDIQLTSMHALEEIALVAID